MRTQAAHLARLAHLWLLTGSPTADKVAEKVIVDRMLRALPRPLRRPVSMTNPRDLASLVEAVELAEATNARDAGERVGLGPRRVMERRPLEGAPRPVSRPAVPDVIDEPMPTEPPAPTARDWMAGCFLHKEGPSPGPSRMVKLDGKPVQALLDSGSSVTLVQPTLLKPRPKQKTELPLMCVHGDTRYVPARTVRISAEPGTWAVEVGIVRDLPVPLLLGRDWPGFEKLLLTHKNPAASARDQPRRKRRGPPSKRPVYLATDSEREGECQPVNIPSVYFDVFQQVTAGGSFGREQREDDRLRNCWEQVRRVDEVDRLPGPHPLPHFEIKNGLLNCVAHRRGEEKFLLVVPKTKTETVIELALAHPMAGHLGMENTIQRIRDRFHWPGLDAEVKRFCRSCPTCQQTSPRRPPPSPLIPLPIIDVPFERIGMDLVGLSV